MKAERFTIYDKIVIENPAWIKDNLKFMTELEAFFADVSRMVDTNLDKLIPTGKKEPQLLYEAVRWSVFAGGKRFRPALVLAVGKAFGADENKLLRTACGVEMIHTYSLIHDD